jgi:hypothetical protein
MPSVPGRSEGPTADSGGRTTEPPSHLPVAPDLAPSSGRGEALVVAEAGEARHEDDETPNPADGTPRRFLSSGA